MFSVEPQVAYVCVAVSVYVCIFVLFCKECSLLERRYVL